MQIPIRNISELEGFLSCTGSFFFVPTGKRLSANIVKNWSRDTVMHHLELGNILFDDSLNPDFVVYNGKRYAKRKDGYYLCTTGSREYLHRVKWEDRYGSIPEGFDVYHIDQNKANNDVKNLGIMSNSGLARTRALWKKFKKLESDLQACLGRTRMSR